MTESNTPNSKASELLKWIEDDKIDDAQKELDRLEPEDLLHLIADQELNAEKSPSAKKLISFATATLNVREINAKELDAKFFKKNSCWIKWATIVLAGAAIVNIILKFWP